MVEELGFPAHLMLIEKELRLLPHLNRVDGFVPVRRVDILCYADRMATPLLLVECKAGALKPRMWLQILGYNRFVQARFLALVGPKQLILALHKGGEREWEIMPVRSFPSFRELTTEMVEGVL